MRKLIILNIVLSVILVFCSAWIFSYHLLSTPYIHENVYIEHIPVGGLSMKTAAMLVESEFSFGRVAFESGGQKWEYQLRDLGYRYEIEEAVKAAYDYGREGTIIGNTIRVIFAEHIEASHIPLQRRENFSAFDKIFPEIRQKIESEPKDAQIRIEQEIVITPEVLGRKVDMEKLSSITKAMLEKDDAGKVIVPVTEEKPRVRQEHLSRINGVVGRYTTVFPPASYNRVYNIRVAASGIDNTLLMPGEAFSFNEKTQKSLYRRASVIVSGKVRQGVGGGICQVSSTLYNSVLYAGLKVTERHRHSIPSGYVPPGRDATVYGDLLDFKFENNKDYPVYIRSYTRGNRLYVLIYGDLQSG